MDQDLDFQNFTSFDCTGTSHESDMFDGFDIKVDNDKKTALLGTSAQFQSAFQTQSAPNDGPPSQDLISLAPGFSQIHANSLPAISSLSSYLICDSEATGTRALVSASSPNSPTRKRPTDQLDDYMDEDEDEDEDDEDDEDNDENGDDCVEKLPSKLGFVEDSLAQETPLSPSSQASTGSARTVITLDNPDPQIIVTIMDILIKSKAKMKFDMQ